MKILSFKILLLLGFLQFSNNLVAMNYAEKYYNIAKAANPPLAIIIDAARNRKKKDELRIEIQKKITFNPTNNLPILILATTYKLYSDLNNNNDPSFSLIADIFIDLIEYLLLKPIIYDEEYPSKLKKLLHEPYELKFYGYIPLLKIFFYYDKPINRQLITYKLLTNLHNLFIKKFIKKNIKKKINPKNKYLFKFLNMASMGFMTYLIHNSIKDQKVSSELFTKLMYWGCYAMYTYTGFGAFQSLRNLVKKPSEN